MLLTRTWKEISNLSDRLTKVLTTDIEVIVSCDDHVGCGALLWLGGPNGVTEQLTLGGRKGGGQHIRVGHYVVDTNAQVFDDLQLVVGIPEVACQRGSGHGRSSGHCAAGQNSLLLPADLRDWNWFYLRQVKKINCPCSSRCLTISAN